MSFLGLLIVISISFYYFQFSQEEARYLHYKRYQSTLFLIQSARVTLEKGAFAREAYFINKEKRYKTIKTKIWTETIPQFLSNIDTLKVWLQSPALTQEFDSLFDQIFQLEQLERKLETAYKNYEPILTDTEDKKTYPPHPQIAAILKEIKHDEFKIYARLDQILIRNEDFLQEGIVAQNQAMSNWWMYTSLAMLSLIVLCTSFYRYYMINLYRTIAILRKLLTQLSQGVLPKHISGEKNEFTSLFHLIEQLIKNLRQASDFSQMIGKGNFDSKYQPQSQHDVLGNSLLEMRNQLKQVTYTDQQRNWVSSGLARFSILFRAQDQNIESLCETILEELILYIGANQGGVFVSKDGEEEGLQYLDLVASYAYDRKKYLEKRIVIHDNYAETLLGQIYLEGEKMLINNLPQDYLYITSGLGDAPPNYLLVIPLKLNEQVEGILEIASFEPFDDFKLEFIDRVCENLAAAIHSIKINIHTQKLVDELKQQTTEMQEQEDQLIRNMDELSSTQEEMLRKQQELEKLKQNLELEINNRTTELRESLVRFDLINQSSSEGLWDIVIPKNQQINEYTEVYWSSNLKKMLGYEENDASFPNQLFSWYSRIHPDEASHVFQSLLDHLGDRSGQTPFHVEHRLLNKQGKYIWVIAQSKTLRDPQGLALRTAGFINDISSQKALDKSLKKLKQREKEREEDQKKLELMNNKLKNNELVLIKSVEKMKKRERDVRETKKTLEKQQQNLKSLLQNVPTVIFQLYKPADSPNFTFTYVSSYSLQLLGLDVEELKSLDMLQLRDFIHPDHQIHFYHVLEDGFKSLKPIQWKGKWHNTLDDSWKTIFLEAQARKAPDKGYYMEGIILNLQFIQHLTDTTYQLN